jgi:hypothetical protein
MHTLGICSVPFSKIRKPFSGSPENSGVGVYVGGGGVFVAGIGVFVAGTGVLIASGSDELHPISTMHAAANKVVNNFINLNLLCRAREGKGKSAYHIDNNNAKVSPTNSNKICLVMSGMDPVGLIEVQ